MEHRLRLVQNSNNSPLAEKRAAARRPVSVPRQMCGRTPGTTRMASVVTRDVSDTGVSVECLDGPAIPLYRIVYFQVDRSARSRTDLPAALRGFERAVGDLPGRRRRPAHREAHRLRTAAPGRTEVQVHGGRYPGIAVRVIRALKPSSFLRAPVERPRHKRTAGTRRPPW